MAFVFYDVVMLPLQFFLEMPPTWLDAILAWVVPIFWTCDMLVSFRTAFWRGGKLIMKQQEITIRYVKTFFAFDLVVVTLEWISFVFNVILKVSSELSATTLLRVFRLLRLMRLLRLVNVASV